MEALAAALNNVALVEQQPYSHRLQSRHHANRVVIAEHAVDLALEAGNHARHSGERCVIRTPGLASVVTRQNTKVVAYLSEEIDHALHCGFAHLDMKVAELKDGEAIEGRRQMGQRDTVVLHLDLCRIVESPPVEAHCHEPHADQEV